MALLLQLPFLFGISTLEKVAPHISHLFVGRTGRHLFLADDKTNQPLLQRMTTDCKEGRFMLVTPLHCQCFLIGKLHIFKSVITPMLRTCLRFEKLMVELLYNDPVDQPCNHSSNGQPTEILSMTVSTFYPLSTNLFGTHLFYLLSYLVLVDLLFGICLATHHVLSNVRFD